MIVSRRHSRKSQIVRVTKRNEVRLHIISILIKIRFIDGEVSKFNVYGSVRRQQALKLSSNRTYPIDRVEYTAIACTERGKHLEHADLKMVPIGSLVQGCHTTDTEPACPLALWLSKSK